MAVPAHLSTHARLRGAQSNLSSDDVEIVRKYGILERRTGVQFYVLRRREVERYRTAEPRLAKLHDVVLIVSGDNTVITIYRNSKALKEIRRKSKIRWGCSG